MKIKKWLVSGAVVGVMFVVGGAMVGQSLLFGGGAEPSGKSDLVGVEAPMPVPDNTGSGVVDMIVTERSGMLVPGHEGTVDEMIVVQ